MSAPTSQEEKPWYLTPERMNELRKTLETDIKDRNRPAQNPGGCNCERCGCVFIGEEWHTFCAVCIEEVKRELREAQNG